MFTGKQRPSDALAVAEPRHGADRARVGRARSARRRRTPPPHRGGFAAGPCPRVGQDSPGILQETCRVHAEQMP